jgi:glycosyltransferase involved in cell wall biosynthesis
MGIDLRAIENAKPDTGMNFDACFVGRLHATKGIFDLIEIWNLVSKSRHGARLVILYSDDIHSVRILQQVRMRLKEYDLTDNVYIPDVVPTDRVYSILKSSKVFVFPSHEEGWGIAICEAMASGLPVVAYDLSPYKEFFTEGLITVKLGDYESFANNILKLLSDESKRREIGQKAIRIASKYTWDATADRELREIKCACNEGN